MLIGDFIWLINLEEYFKGQRHIIILTPDLSINEESADLSQEISAMGSSMQKKSDTRHNQMIKRLEAAEKNSRQQAKSQQTVIVSKVKQLIKESLKEAFEEHRKQDKKDAEE